jgi:D-alanyl-D-alanine carboxypeptidase
MPSRPSLTDALTRHLDRVTRRRAALGAPQVLLLGPELEYSYGNRALPFHAASIGKLATTALVMQLVDDLDTPVVELLPAPLLESLFVVNGVDHAAHVTVRQLLDHTSGVADYFDGPTIDGPPVRHLILSEPDRAWRPTELLDISRRTQRAVGAPGAQFAYSDTGYILLGLLLEQVSGRSFEDLLRERIFEPLGMRDSFLAPRPGVAIAPAWLDGADVSTFRSLSADWAGGGIVSTPDDLARLGRALHDGTLVNEAQLAEMQRARHRFRPGIHYGTGMMTLRFSEFFFTLRGLPALTGHIGVLGTHLFHDPVNDVVIVMNFASTREMVASFRTLIQIEAQLRAAARRRPASR